MSSGWVDVMVTWKFLVDRDSATHFLRSPTLRLARDDWIPRSTTTLKQSVYDDTKTFTCGIPNYSVSLGAVARSWHDPEHPTTSAPGAIFLSLNTTHGVSRGLKLRDWNDYSRFSSRDV